VLSPEAAADRPYPDESAAVHHLVEEGWLYSLRFDDGRVSAGVLLDRHRGAGRIEGSPTEIFERVIAGYPTLRRLFADAKARCGGPRVASTLQRRMAQAVGEGWAAMPQTYAFWDPIFSTGIAWSLVGAERLAAVLSGPHRQRQLERYGRLLQREADHLEALAAAAYGALASAAAFRGLATIYFVTASDCELRQRLLDAPEAGGWAWQGFLGAGDPLFGGLFSAARDRLHRRSGDGEAFEAWASSITQSRNLIGVGERSDGFYAVDLAVLRSRAGGLGLSGADFDRLAPRLRGCV